MEKARTQFSSSRLLAAAVASVGLAGFATSQSDAGLVVDLRALLVNGGGTVAPDGKSVTANSSGVTVQIGVFARISGTNALQTVLNVNGDGTDLLTFNDDMLQSLVGRFQSVGPRLGNMAPTAGMITQAGFTTYFAPYNAGGVQNGTAADYDSDGDLDIGDPNAPFNDPSTLFAARASSPLQAAFDDQTGGGGGTSKGYVSVNGSSYNPNINSSLINASTNEVRIGTLKFIVDGGSGHASVNFAIRPTNDAGAALWFEDGNLATAKNPGNSSFSVSAPVDISVAPEPASIGLLGVAALGLFARRRRDA